MYTNDFDRRYFTHLRQESMPATDTVYRTRQFNRGITSHELEGLEAVLELIKNITGMMAVLFIKFVMWLVKDFDN